MHPPYTNIWPRATFRICLSSLPLSLSLYLDFAIYLITICEHKVCISVTLWNLWIKWKSFSMLRPPSTLSVINWKLEGYFYFSKWLSPSGTIISKPAQISMLAFLFLFTITFYFALLESNMSLISGGPEPINALSPF